MVLKLISSESFFKMFNINNALFYLIITINSFDDNIMWRAPDYRYDKSITEHIDYHCM